jgi:hypothetical protein
VRVTRVPPHDVYDVAAECVVFVDDHVLALSGRATAAYRAVDGPATTVDRIATAMRAALGDPPVGTSIHDAAQATLLELVELGLLTGSDDI